MFKKIIAAYNESAEASRALLAAIQLAKALGAELHAVTILKSPPASTAFAAAASPSFTQTLIDDQWERIEQLMADARESAKKQGVELTTHLVEGQEIEAIVRCIVCNKADLLVIGIHQHSLYVSLVKFRAIGAGK